MTGPEAQEANRVQLLPDMKSLSERLVLGYKKETELYSSILKLTELQRTDLGESDDVRDFITLLHQKDDLIRAIDEIELDVESDKTAWLHAPDRWKNTCNDELNSILDGIIVLIEGITQVERQNEELLRTRKDDTERELHVIRKTYKAAREYKTGPDAKVISAVK